MNIQVSHGSHGIGCRFSGELERFVNSGERVLDRLLLLVLHAIRDFVRDIGDHLRRRIVVVPEIDDRLEIRNRAAEIFFDEQHVEAERAVIADVVGLVVGVLGLRARRIGGRGFALKAAVPCENQVATPACEPVVHVVDDREILEPDFHLDFGYGRDLRGRRLNDEHRAGEESQRRHDAPGRIEPSGSNAIHVCAPGMGGSGASPSQFIA